MKKRISTLISLGILTAGFIGVLNQVITYRAENKKALPMKGKFFEWRGNDFFYTVKGEGSPILLIHDLNCFSSGYEWNRIVGRLQKNNKIYTVDLPGCGRSDKPNMTYTTYYYADYIHNFIQNVIGEKVTIIASHKSSGLAILSKRMNPDDIAKIILVNPNGLSDYDMMPDTQSKIVKSLIQIPILGTFIYNIENSEENLRTLFKTKYFEKRSNVTEKIVDVAYESSHFNLSTGRFLLASIRGKFMNANIKAALGELDNIYIIQSRDINYEFEIIQSYRKYAKKSEESYISGDSMYPQLEHPEKFCETLNLFL